MKKLGLLFATVVMIMLFAFSASALEATGQCGDNAYWTFDETTGELVITGSGEIYKDIFLNKNEILNVVINEGISAIGPQAFYACYNIDGITFPNSLTSIGAGALAYCDNLINVTIPKDVSYIGDYVLVYCKSLVSIAVDDNNKYYSSDEYGALFDKQKTKLLQYPVGNIRKEYSIPQSVKTLDEWVFYGCKNLNYITIPDGVVSIGAYTFGACENLINITIPQSVVSLGSDSVFSNCKSLISITVDKNNKYYTSDDYGVLFNKSMTKLIQYPVGNKRTEYSIPNGVTNIADWAFFDCGSIQEITIPKGVTIIEDHVFRWCKSLTNIIIPNTVTTIGEYAFEDCISLTDITIPSSVTRIRECAFNNCSSLTDVYYLGTQEQWNQIVIESRNEYLINAKIHFHNHSYGENITKLPTHFEEGVKTFTCNCGDAYMESIAKIEHIYTVSNIVAPTCEKEGYTVYVCACGHSYNGDKISATGHDYDGDNCKICGESKIENCNCNCHKGGISGFFWKIANFFNKLFKIKSKQSCACGVAHF